MLNYLKTKKNAIFTGVILSFMVFFIQFSSQPEIQKILARFDGIFYDLRLRVSLSQREITDQAIIIIDLDEKSLAAEGRWPWSRAKVATMVHKLADLGVAVVAFDVLFSEPERNPVDTVKRYFQAQNSPIPEQLINLSPALDADSIFSESLTETDVVLGILFQQDDRIARGELPASVVKLNTEQPLNKIIRMSFPGYESNIDILQSASPGSGFINSSPDQDGFIRRAALVVEHEGTFYPSLALEAARLLTFSEKINIDLVDIGNGVQQMSGVRWGNEVIPTDAAGRVLVPYRGGRKSFPYISATDVLHDNVDESLFEGAVALVGTSAVGLSDLRATPVEVQFPGVEVHANVLEGLLHPKILPQEPDWWEAAVALVLFVLGIFCVFFFPAMGPLTLSVTAITIMVLTAWFNFWLWQQHQISLMLTTSLLLVLVVATFNLAIGFFKETSQKKMIKGIFDQYVPPAHIDQMLADPDSVNLDGERREMTVLFSDIRSFTNISEKLTATELKKLLNSYFNPITKCIFDNKGTIDKYVGDMVMAFWGAPLTDDNHAVNALDAALDMLVITERLRSEFKTIGLPEIYVGIGLNTGDMNVGDMGSEYRRAYTVLGDSVNLGARLESLTKFYGVECLVSETTKAKCPDHTFRLIDRVRVKGKKESVTIYEPIGRNNAIPEAFYIEEKDHLQAYDNYLAKNWGQATEQFQALNDNHFNRKIYQIYIDRIEALSMQSLEHDWNGVFTHQNK